MADDAVPYRVLARKYRPQTFNELIGQEAMVRTLANAIAAGRLAHAFILTGVRGIGKTTTARLIARALNCIGADGKGGPTTTPCGQCEHCVAIAESRHVDVLEMDAASRTGVDDIREIIDGSRYSPASARYKIYIIDEVHMLSRNAFNALLKTLEEPPRHVKFLFATTEIRKLPVTVLSRCQRFDLRRVDQDILISHLDRICGLEEVKAEPVALAMIARAAEGSVRDALSLLDQAIAHGAGAVDEQQVRDMLGLADRARILDLTRAVMAGKVMEALAALREQYDLGADPEVVLSDMLETIHWLTRLKLSPDAGENTSSEAERTLGAEMAKELAMPHLTRAWQMLLKGLQDVRIAPQPISAAEMVLIRLAYAADLPTPADAIKMWQQEKDRPAKGGREGNQSGPDSGIHGRDAPSATKMQAHSAAEEPSQASQPTKAHGGARIMALRQDVGSEADTPKHPVPLNFEAMVALFREEKEGVLAATFKDLVRPVAYRPGLLTITLDDRAPADFSRRVKACLTEWTGMDWQVVINTEGGTETIWEKELAHKAQVRETALQDPLLKEVMAIFPGATLVEVHEMTKMSADSTNPADSNGEREESEE